MLPLSGFFPFLPLPFVRFCSGSGYSAFCFFLSSFFPFPPLSCFPGAPSLPFGFLGFPRSFRPGFPCLLSRFFVLGFLFVSFHPSRLRSHSCSTDASLLLSLSGFSLALLSFVCFRSVLTTQPSVLSFPLFPLSPVGGSRGAFSSSVRPVSMPSFRFWYSAFCVSFLRSPSRYTAATSAPQPSSFRSPASSPLLSL